MSDTRLLMEITQTGQHINRTEFNVSSIPSTVEELVALCNEQLGFDIKLGYEQIPWHRQKEHDSFKSVKGIQGLNYFRPKCRLILNMAVNSPYGQVWLSVMNRKDFAKDA